MDSFEYSVDDIGDVTVADQLMSWAADSSWQRHWLFHRICQENYKKRHGALPSSGGDGSSFAARGISEYASVLDQNNCATLVKSMDEHMAQVLGADGKPDQFQYIIPWTQHRANIFRRALPRILSDELSSVLIDYYGCEFQLLAANLRRHYPSEKTDVSFTWHRDFEPGQQVHLIVYLNGASDDTGRTEVLDLAATRKAAEAGYGYPDLANRTNDLDEVFGGSAEGVEIVSPSLEPGGGILLAAPRVLHRGRLPQTSRRDTLLLVFVPSPIPWRARLACRFNNTLMNGQSLTAGIINPLDHFSLSNQSAHGYPPEWAIRGDLYPPDGQPQ